MPSVRAAVLNPLRECEKLPALKWPGWDPTYQLGGCEASTCSNCLTQRSLTFQEEDGSHRERSRTRSSKALVAP